VPDVTIATIESNAAVRSRVAREAATRCAAAARHQRTLAGGHLVAMMIATDWRAHGFDAAPFVAGVSLSGVHDLEPLVLFAHNVDFRLDEAAARAVSPVNHLPQADVPLMIAVGERETSEFVRQSQLLWDAWPHNRRPQHGGPMSIAAHHHFSVVLEYADSDSALTRETLALFPRARG
jgi:arylformamidase